MARQPEVDWDRVPDEELKESFLERIEGLKEMFPPALVNGASSAANWSKKAASYALWFTKNAVWIFATTGMIMVMPYMIEKEYADSLKQTDQQQRSALLGPSSAVQLTKAGQQ